MLNLLLLAMFTAFFLAVFDGLKELVSVFTNEVFANALFSLSFSALGAYLLDNPFDKTIVVVISAGAFAGRALLAIVERLATARPVVINQTRQ